ncbi:Rieske (2Fe-2S) protein [Kitasatospora sp. NPDC006697]|uniref:Rieske (2Fe-2S) protein n=1 Tax=Kitasatospora sp. NPDC006697 TaxID=3364020 RepID=UPI003698607C
MSETVDQPAASRRAVLCCTAALASGAALTVAGCGSSASGAGGSGSQTTAAKSSGGPLQLGSAEDIPVGGGKVFREQRIVVTQPQPNQFKAFSARCTHAGCIVDTVSRELIKCPCHGSAFNVADGSVAGGPAPSPLTSYPVTVQNGQLTVTTS